MILVSAALVLLAVVLLAVGLGVSGAGLLYASAACSVAALLVLLVQARGRRAPVAPPEAPAQEPVEPRVVPRSARGAAVAPTPEAPDGVAAPSRPGRRPSATGPVDEHPADVVVLPDRPRYHRAGCRYVQGAARARTVPREQALPDHVPCEVCRP